MKHLTCKKSVLGLVCVVVWAVVIASVCLYIACEKETFTASDFGFTAKVENVTRSGATFIISHSSVDANENITLLNSTNNINMVYVRNLDSFSFVDSFSTGGSEFYQMERLEKGKWVKVEAKTDSFISTLPLCVIPFDESVKFNIDWSERYGALSSGTYRLIKNISSKFGTETVELDVCAEFEIK